MSFQSLPVEVQVVAAKALVALMLQPENKKEPAVLAQEVIGAFEVLSGDRTAHKIDVILSRTNQIMQYLADKLPTKPGDRVSGGGLACDLGDDCGHNNCSHSNASKDPDQGLKDAAANKNKSASGDGCARNLPPHSKIALELIQLELIKPEPLEGRSMQLLNTLQQVLQGSGISTGTLDQQSYSHQSER